MQRDTTYYAATRVPIWASPDGALSAHVTEFAGSQVADVHVADPTQERKCDPLHRLAAQAPGLDRDAGSTILFEVNH